jgi:hypothetical protein
MSRLRIGKMITVSFLAGLCFSGVSWGEDAFVDVGVPQLAKTRPGNFMNAIPFSTFVVTVAHLGPSPEHALERGRPARCDAVQFRVDELTVKAEDGSINVELGERQVLAPGESARFVYEVPGQPDEPNLPPDRLETYKLDLMGFRVSSQRASDRCSIVANALFYADPFIKAPIPLALIPSVSPSLKLNR